VVGTWLALGIATGVFDARYLFAIPVLLLHFAAFYSFSAMLAVWTRSTVVCVFGTLLFWVMCWAMNYGRHTVVAHDPPGMSAGSRAISSTLAEINCRTGSNSRSVSTPRRWRQPSSSHFWRS